MEIDFDHFRLETTTFYLTASKCFTGLGNKSFLQVSKCFSTQAAGNIGYGGPTLIVCVYPEFPTTNLQITHDAAIFELVFVIIEIFAERNTDAMD